MKKKNLTFAVTIAMVVAGFSAFGQQNTKVAEERKDVSEAKADLREAKADSIADFQKFKKDAETKIQENQKKIGELKAKKSEESKEVKEKYDKKILTLEQKNNELRKRMENCNRNDKSAWESFKNKFTHEMDELTASIKDFGSDNKK